MTAAAPAAEGWWPRTAGSVESLNAWRRYGLAFVLGAVGVAAQAPVHAIPMLAVSFTGLVWLVDASRSRWSAFLAGWWFAFGYFVAGLYWIAHAMLTDPAKFGWMIPFAVGGLAAYLAIYSGLATLAVHAAGVRGAGRVLILAVAWAAAEWARGHVLTGFPWNLVGNVWTAVPPVMQLAAFIGAYGLSLLTVAAAASPAALADRRPRAWVPVAAAVVLLGASWTAGALRLPEGPAPSAPGVLLRIVQPNISQDHKWRDDRRAANLRKLLALSTAPAADRPSHIVWPETAAPFFVATDEPGRRIMAAAVPGDGYIITGAMRTTPRSEQPFRIWNSINAVDGAGAVRATYDKFHLVPFGEFVPLRSVLPVAKLTPGSVDFSRGPGPVTLTLPGTPPFSPLICYEVIFPGAVTAQGPRPAWLLNVTNDAWFGISSGPYQHFASARMRAVEEGLPLARAANTGISAVVDPYGRVVALLGLAHEGSLDSRLPVPLAKPTVYARLGDLTVLMLSLLALAVAALIGMREKSTRDSIERVESPGRREMGTIGVTPPATLVYTGKLWMRKRRSFAKVFKKISRAEVVLGNKRYSKHGTDL